jgi:hypothetical protein
MTPEIQKDKTLCQGCRDNFYNGNNPLGVKECWSFKSAKVVKRWRIGWWTMQDKRENFTPVTTLSCHNAPGQYAHYKELPAHLGGDKP